MDVCLQEFLQMYLVWYWTPFAENFRALLTNWGRDKMAYEIFKCTFLDETCCILIKKNISVKYVRKGPIDNNPAFVQIMAWRRKATSHSLTQWWPRLLTHICVSRPQWVKTRTPCWIVKRLLLGKRSLDNIVSSIPFIFSRGWYSF